MRGKLAALFVITACNSAPHGAATPDAPGGGTHDAPAAMIDAPPMPAAGKIQHVIVIVKENHTFDNYFGSFPGAEGTTTFQLPDGGTGSCGHAPDNTFRDMDHDHEGGLVDWNHGAMNGWDSVSGSSVNGDRLAYAQYH